MKYLTTAVPYRELVLETDKDGAATRKVSNVPLEVSNEEAEKIEKIGERVGVKILVHDEKPGSDATAAQVQATPDLSAGVASITGTGEPVSTPDTTEATTSSKKRGS